MRRSKKIRQLSVLEMPDGVMQESVFIPQNVFQKNLHCGLSSTLQSEFNNIPERGGGMSDRQHYIPRSSLIEDIQMDQLSAMNAES